jgi:Phosphopantetheine attachment site
VGLDDNFFDLGGHSLLLVQVHSKLEKVLQRDIPMVAMFTYPTINALTRHLGQQDGELEPLQQSEGAAQNRTVGRNRLKALKQRRRQPRQAGEAKGE